MEDMRITKNKTLLKNTLIENCSHDVHDMTVSKLCSLAKVSRPTFYAYYDGIHSVIEDIERQYLPLLLEDPEDDNNLHVTLRHMDTLYKNKQAYLFLFRNGRADRIIQRISRSLFKERPARANVAISEDTVSLFINFLTPASVQLFIYALEHSQTISYEQLAQLHLIIESHAYAMIAEYEKLPK